MNNMETLCKETVEEFIQRRFPQDCNWTTGNCYFFALILQAAFGGEIYYDVVNGHFVTKIKNKYYDWTGVVEDAEVLVKWDKFDKYDKAQKERIIRNCIR